MLSMPPIEGSSFKKYIHTSSIGCVVTVFTKGAHGGFYIFSPQTSVTVGNMHSVLIIRNETTVLEQFLFLLAHLLKT